MYVWVGLSTVAVTSSLQEHTTHRPPLPAAPPYPPPLPHAPTGTLRGGTGQEGESGEGEKGHLCLSLYCPCRFRRGVAFAVGGRCLVDFDGAVDLQVEPEARVVPDRARHQEEPLAGDKERDAGRGVRRGGKQCECE